MSWHYEKYEMAAAPMFQVWFENAETKQRIMVYIPSTGIFHNARQRTTAADVKKISDELRKVFKKVLD